MGRVRCQAAVLLCLVVVGCSTTESGTAQPRAVDTSSDGADGTGGTSATGLPARPRSVGTAGVDPCSLIPEDQKALLEIDRPPVSNTDETLGGPLCTYSVSGWGVYGLTTTDQFTATEFYADNKTGLNTVIDVSGFPALENYKTISPTYCTVVVDTSDTGLLWTTIGDRRATSADRTSLCQRTADVAAIALTALEAQQ